MYETCPRCGNSEIKPNDKFCKICGLNFVKHAVRVLISKGVTPEMYKKAIEACKQDKEVQQ